MNWAHVHVVVNHLPIFAMGFAALFLAVASISGHRAVWMRAAMVLLVISFVGVASAFLSGSPALEVIEGQPRTSARALTDHHIAALVATIVSGMVVATISTTYAVRRRRDTYSRWTVAAHRCSGRVARVGGARGRAYQSPELQEPQDRTSGPAHPH